jgi:UDP-N-acetyl-D-galactosamine dehydrogenase
MGLTFKENCPDLRNTRVVDIIEELQSYNVNVDVYDPWINADEAEHEFGVRPLERPEKGVYDAIVLAVAHDQFRDMGAAGIRAFGKDASVLYDVKHLLPVDDVDGRL